MVSQGAEKITSKTSSSEPKIDPNAERRINSIPWWGIVVIILVLIFLIAIFIYVIIADNREVNRPIKPNDSYILMWGDDFSTGTSSGRNIENEKIVLPISSRTGLRQIDDSGKRYPDLEKWTLQQSMEAGPTYFTKSVQNAFILNCKLHSRLLRQSTIINQEQINNSSNVMRNRYEYDFTSARVISRIATNGGFFNFRLKPPTETGIKVKISLLPYINTCMNVIGSEYGPWPLCGEITIFEYNSDDHYWRGNLIYGTKRHPIDDKIQKLSPNQWQIVGLHWTNDCIDWIYNGSVSDGQIKGDIVQSIPSREWYTIALNDGECYCEEQLSEGSINDLLTDNSYRKVASPAPFDQPFNIVMEITTSNQSNYYSLTNNDIAGELTLDWVKLYNRSIASDLSIDSLLNIE